jgi:peroxiredoxin Q/BCP
MELPASKGSGLDQFDIRLFAASCDSVATNTRYAKALDLDYVVLSDPSKQVASAYGVVHESRSLPERWTFIIDADGTILDIMTEVDVKDHGAEIARRLDTLGVPRIGND